MAAVAAQVPTIGVLTTQPVDVLKRKGCFMTIRDYTDP